ncbi:DNA polymerase III, subunits gamma and tau [Crinalium epipsammum PCC 9333]|uniref:DNA polymerase III subunit gamma/tau n=1 Tax=Crinalium epipsammum PCC 9333 TaxID=1173022 RepID=K9VV02_9CYAN|nr:DNA polymerase III subunit gamma/tau [Crinalium epipsammum]AFZ11389.1 DNA polymerase III, subunits gamma and tau [Crinalium epipsammum PCC 9333]
MHTPLTLKYRPQLLADLVGQDCLSQTLTNAIKSGRIAPAYLFTGPKGTGKTSTARILAKSLNCSNNSLPTVTPCGKCQSCRSIEKSSSLDVSEIDAASHNGVDDARALIERSHLAPVGHGYRIFILDEVHCLSSQAFNALLKCLEEPPAKVIFILCTTEAHKILPTIVSRCQVLNFKAVSIANLIKQLTNVAELEEIAINEAALTALARTADGGMRDALQLLDQLSLLEVEITPEHIAEISGDVNPSDLIAILKAIRSKNTASLLQLSSKLLDSGISPKAILVSLLKVYRDLLAIASDPTSKNNDLLISTVSAVTIRKVAESLGYNQIQSSLQQLREAEYQLKQALQPALWVEVCLLGLIPESTINTNKKASENAPIPATTAPKPKPKTDTPAKIWQKTLATTTAKNQAVLSIANLCKLEESTAELAVPQSHLTKFEGYKAKITKMLGEVTGREITLTLVAEKNQ